MKKCMGKICNRTEKGFDQAERNCGRGFDAKSSPAAGLCRKNQMPVGENVVVLKSGFEKTRGDSYAFACH